MQLPAPGGIVSIQIISVAPGTRQQSDSVEGGGVKKFCPYCLANDIDDFQELVTADHRQFTCPKPTCNRTLSNRYVEEHDDRHRIMFSIIGLSGNGKTCYLAALFHVLDRLAKRNDNGWESFDYGPGDQQSLSVVRSAQQDLEAGDLPESTTQAFPEPVCLFVDGMPEVNPMVMLMYDTSGETFTDVNYIQESARYTFESRVLLCIISLTGTEAAQSAGLKDMLDRYEMALREKTGRLKQQSIVVVIASGDELLSDPSLPPRSRNLLTQEQSFEPEFQSRLDADSAELEEWLVARRSLGSFVKTAKRVFRSVRFCVVSALGSKPSGRKMIVKLQPRNLLAPVWWLLRESNPTVTLQDDKTQETKVVFSLAKAIGEASIRRRPTTLILSADDHFIEDCVEMTGNLTLRGTGKGATRVIGLDGKSILRYRGGGKLSITGILFEYRGNCGSHVCTIGGGIVEVSECQFRGGLRGEARKYGCGLLITGQSRVTILDCEMSHNEMYGILVQGGADVSPVARLRANNCSENGSSGIALVRVTGGEIIENRCLNNEWHGIFLRDTSAATVSRNHCISNKTHGICLLESPSAKNAPAEGYTIDGNICDKNAETGILLGKKSEGTVCQNHCTGNHTGIAVLGTSIVENNKISTSEIGLLIDAAASPKKTFPNNRFVGNKIDILDNRKKSWW